MAKTTMQFLENFKTNDFMCWHVCSQCANLGSVALRDDNNTYFEVKKTSRSTDMQHLEKGGAYYKGGRNLRVEFTVETGSELQVSNSSDGILDSKGRNVGFIYDFCIEDSTDDDFNDFYANIVAWKRKG